MRGDARLRRVRTLLLVHTQHDNDLVTTDTDKLLDRPDASSRELGEQDHTLDVVVLELRAPSGTRIDAARAGQNAPA
jgi:hypothetical protein